MLKGIKFKENEIMFVQHLFFTNIDINDIINVCKNNKLKLVITVHDWYWLNERVLYEYDNKTELGKNSFFPDLSFFIFCFIDLISL